jgi:hypothetical protein
LLSNIINELSVFISRVKNLQGITVPWSMDVEKSKPLTILPLENDISTIQKCYLPSVYSEILKKCEVGSCILLQISSTTRCVCKLYWKRDLHKAFCHIDESVLTFSGCERMLMGVPKETVNRTYSELSLEQIQVLSSCVAIKDLQLSVVFENVSDNKRWHEYGDTLQDIVKDILKLYLLVKNSIVYAKNLNECQKFGIHCIVIHDIGGLETGNAPTIGRVVSGTELSVVHRLSRTWLKQLQNHGLEAPLGGLDGPYQTLQEIICQHKLYRQAAGKLGFRPCRQVTGEMS